MAVHSMIPGCGVICLVMDKVFSIGIRMFIDILINN